MSVYIIYCDQSGCRSSSPFPGPESVAQKLAASEGWTGVAGDRAACPECNADPWRQVASDLVPTGRGYVTISPAGVRREDPRGQQ